VFEDTGFLEARISDIADRAGLSHGSFYHYFDSKEQVFREVAEAQEALLTAPDDAGPESDGADLSELERICRANRRYFDFDKAVQQVSRLWANAIGLRGQRTARTGTWE
jgi:AcrR family transcriptional regulator